MVSIGFLRASCQPIWVIPSAMPSTTDKVTFFVVRVNGKEKQCRRHVEQQQLPGMEQVLHGMLNSGTGPAIVISGIAFQREASLAKSAGCSGLPKTHPEGAPMTAADDDRR